MLKVTETLFKDAEIAVYEDLNSLLLLLTHCGFTLQLNDHLNREQEFAEIYMHAPIYAKNPPPKLKHQTFLLRTQGTGKSKCHHHYFKKNPQGWWKEKW